MASVYRKEVPAVTLLRAGLPKMMAKVKGEAELRNPKRKMEERVRFRIHMIMFILKLRRMNPPTQTQYLEI